MSLCMLPRLLLLLHTTAAIVYNVRSNDSSFTNNDNAGNSLEYYLKNASKYFSSDNCHLNFKLGHHYLNTDLVIQNITIVTLTGEGLSFIRCTSHVNIIIFNVTNFRLKNIVHENCSANYSNHLHTSFRYHFASTSKPSGNVSILLYHCLSVNISNITVIANEGNCCNEGNHCIQNRSPWTDFGCQKWSPHANFSPPCEIIISKQIRSG